MDDLQLRLLLLLAAAGFLSAALLVFALRLRRRSRSARSEKSQQRRDALRSIKLMLQQMEYDAEVLRLLRHARASRERQNETDFNGALDALVRKEEEMMARVDRAAEFEGYIVRTYKGRDGPARPAGRPKSPLVTLKEKGDEAEGPGDDDLQPPSSPEELKKDIGTFISDLERIRSGELKLLDEKIAFFERWVEGPERQDILKSLRAMALFLEKGDATGLEKLKNGGSGYRGRGPGSDKQGSGSDGNDGKT